MDNYKYPQDMLMWSCEDDSRYSEVYQRMKSDLAKQFEHYYGFPPSATARWSNTLKWNEQLKCNINFMKVVDRVPPWPENPGYDDDPEQLLHFLKGNCTYCKNCDHTCSIYIAKSALEAKQ